MDKYNKENLKKAGMDIDRFYERFNENYEGAEAFIKDLTDKNKSFIQFFESLKEEVSKSNSNAAGVAAKNLKGLCAEFYIMGFESILSKLSDFLNDGDIKTASEIMPEVVHQYEVISEALKAAFN